MDPASAVTSAATLPSHGGLLQRIIDVGLADDTTAASEDGMGLGAFPVVKQNGKRDEIDDGTGMGVGSERNVGARIPILNDFVQNEYEQADIMLLMDRVMSLHAYI
jgi:hypothetical protein